MKILRRIARGRKREIVGADGLPKTLIVIVIHWYGWTEMKWLTGGEKGEGGGRGERGDGSVVRRRLDRG